MTKHYTLRYFDIIGLAETSRLLLTAAGVEWTNEVPEWPQEKPNQPFGRLPVLVEKSADGSPDFVLSESQTIERYIARTYGLVPADPKEAAVQEQLRDQIADVVLGFFAFAFLKGEEDKKEKRARFDAILQKLIEVQTKALQKNGNNGYLFGDRVSYADAAALAAYKNLIIGSARYDAALAGIVKAQLTPEIAKHLKTVEADIAAKADKGKIPTSLTVAIDA
ncbi:hypothetical protein H4R18_001548 [Coemansia javaensis]|uniref:glutathione transferase n=1 Tax=Coemansia javaensis TaxID=2761396 RepID=A0A9W8HEV3_9FUNG|nr:hypothetical protein H4R18_001548 [Coemansia javaensis]